MFRKLLLLLVLSAACSPASATIPRFSTNPDDFVRAGVGHFWLHGQPMRAVGYNLRGLCHYGCGDIMSGATAQDRLTDLQFMKSINAKVARVFCSYNAIGNIATGDRLNTALRDAAANDVYVIVTLTDAYAVTTLYPQGDQQYHTWPGGDLPNQQWYAGGYLNNYWPQVQYLVNRFKYDPTIFAWELGNELKCPWNWSDLLPFSQDMASRIRAIDPYHMISQGTASASFAGLNQQQALELHRNFDFVGVHVYNGSDAAIDVAVANQLDKPLLVTEAGMSSGIYNSTQRPAATDADIAKWIGLGADGYMNWGLMATDRNIGDGDSAYGIDKVLHSDWNAYKTVYTNWASALATTPLPAPDKPTNVAASDGGYPDRVRVTWNAALGGQEYAVFRSEVLPENPPSMNVMQYALGYSECGHIDESTRGICSFDGNVNTRWSCAHNGANTAGDHWIAYDLGSTCKVSKFIVKHASSGGDSASLNTRAYYIESGPSLDGPWTTEFFINNAGGAASNTITYATPKNLRYVRLLVIMPTMSGDWIARIPEFEVWGIPGAGRTVQVSDWQTGLQFDDTSAMPGTQYIYSVAARNSTGEGAHSVSDTGFAAAATMIGVGQARSQADGALVYLRGTVSAVFGDRFYVQQPDAPAGLAVVSSQSVSLGETVTVFGTMSSSDGERRVVANVVAGQ